MTDVKGPPQKIRHRYILTPPFDSVTSDSLSLILRQGLVDPDCSNPSTPVSRDSYSGTRSWHTLHGYPPRHITVNPSLRRGVERKNVPPPLFGLIKAVEEPSGTPESLSVTVDPPPINDKRSEEEKKGARPRQPVG